MMATWRNIPTNSVSHTSKNFGCCASQPLISQSGEPALLSQEGGVSWKVTVVSVDQTLANCFVVCRFSACFVLHFSFV